MGFCKVEYVLQEGRVSGVEEGEGLVYREEIQMYTVKVVHFGSVTGETQNRKTGFHIETRYSVMTCM
jgi:hypothetical protein